MRPTQRLHEAGQSIWLDNITRALLTSGMLQRYVDELSVTGLTSNPSIFDKAIEGTSDYDDPIASKVEGGASGEELFFELALEAGVDLDMLAARLQSEDAEAFDVAWNDLLSCLSRKANSLVTVR